MKNVDGLQSDTKQTYDDDKMKTQTVDRANKENVQMTPLSDIQWFSLALLSSLTIRWLWLSCSTLFTCSSLAQWRFHLTIKYCLFCMNLLHWININNKKCEELFSFTNMPPLLLSSASVISVHNIFSVQCCWPDPGGGGLCEFLLRVSDLNMNLLLCTNKKPHLMLVVKWRSTP